MRVVTRDWRELVAGSEGFLTGNGRAGFEGREVVWGEMVSSSDKGIWWEDERLIMGDLGCYG